MGKVQFLFFSSFLLVSTKFSFWEKDWALGYNSMKFLDLDVSWFPKILSFKSFGNSQGNSYVPRLLLVSNLNSFHLWWKDNLVKYQKVSKYYDEDCLINFLLRFMSLLTAPVFKNSQPETILAKIYETKFSVGVK